MNDSVANVVAIVGLVVVFALYVYTLKRNDDDNAPPNDPMLT